MFCLNQRIGIVFKESIPDNRKDTKKVYSIHYFFINDEKLLFYTQNLPRLQKIIRVSKSFHEVTSYLVKMNQKKFDVSKYQINGIKDFNTDGILPFSNRSSIQIKEKSSSQILQLIPLVDEDINFLLEFLKYDSKSRKSTQQSTKKNATFLEQEELKQQKLVHNLFLKYIELQPSLALNYSEMGVTERIQDQSSQPKPKEIIKYNQNLQYLGDVVNGKPHGEGKQVLMNEGFSFNGSFLNGRKHGKGYLVNSNLDTLYCEFIDDQISGI